MGTPYADQRTHSDEGVPNPTELSATLVTVAGATETRTGWNCVPSRFNGRTQVGGFEDELRVIELLKGEHPYAREEGGPGG